MTAYRDAIQKKALYARHGVKEYWIVALKEKMVEVYEPKDGLYHLIGTYLKGDEVESRVLKGFKVVLKEIF